MTGQVLAIAAVAAVAAACLARSVVRTPRRLAVRLAPYAERARGQLGTSVPARATAVTSVWGPMVLSAASWVGRAIDAGSSTDLELRLRRAGLAHLTASGYRRKQLAYAVSGLVGGVVLALALQLSTSAALILGLG